mgnify:CR=1 FL=1|tara:strand:- start:673 stop:1098 length:426 start_codon:yes stop_codon:yes gene_type:complete
MIYVEEKDFSRQLDLLRYLSGLHRLIICSWLYPESTSTSVAGFPINNVPSNLQPTTIYANGIRPRHTEPVEATAPNITAFEEAASEIAANCDSLALYGEGEESWFAATIGHEGMCLVQDESLFSSLSEAGYSVSMEPPSWW